jgi:cysteine desulfuration protein SufE
MPPALLDLITFFEPLGEADRRAALMDLADEVRQYAPQPGDHYDLEDVRKDTECSDKVGIHLRQQDGDRIAVAISLGCQVQTLTRALSTILCRGLSGATRQDILGLSQDFIPRIVGAELVQLRSRTIYYVLGRLKAAVAALSP